MKFIFESNMILFFWFTKLVHRLKAFILLLFNFEIKCIVNLNSLKNFAHHIYHQSKVLVVVK